MTVFGRRYASRGSRDWSLGYRLEDGAGWRDCRLIDVTGSGATIELYGVREEDDLSGSFDLQLRSATAGDFVLVNAGLIGHVHVDNRRVIIAARFILLPRNARELLNQIIGSRVGH
jgi:hypothetical protein